MKRSLATLPFVMGLALVATASCTSPSKGALVLAISTDMETPKDIDVVSVFITTNSVVKFDYLGRVLPDGSVALPATLAVVEPDAPNAQVRIRVIGFQGQTARVLRDVLTTVPHEQRSLLRLPLNFLDDGSGQGSLSANLVPLGPGGAPEGDSTFDPDMIASSCDFGQQLTSVNGACVTAVVDSSTLPPYDPTDVYGDGGLQPNGAPTTCFDVATCFAAATPVTGVDLATCSFPLPAQGAPVETVDASEVGPADASTAPVDRPDTGAPVKAQDNPLTLASSLNFALVTPNAGSCATPGQCFVPLENDANEGWTLSGGTVKMIPGICARLMAGARLATSNGACPSKALSLPVCESTGGRAADGGVAIRTADGGIAFGPGDSSTVGVDEAGAVGPAVDGTTGKACSTDANCHAGANVNRCSSDYPVTLANVSVQLWSTPVCILPIPATTGNCDPAPPSDPTGQRAHFCDGPDSPQSPGVCVPNTPGAPAGQQGLCYPKCTFAADGSPPTGCAGSNRCAFLATTSTGGVVSGVGFCQSTCQADADCSALGSGYVCQTDVGGCTQSPVNRSVAPGIACTAANAACTCVSAGNAAGYCSTPCVVGGTACPNGWVCDTGEPSTAAPDSGVSPFTQQNTGMAGVCLAACTAADAAVTCPSNSTCASASVAGPDCQP